MPVRVLLVENDADQAELLEETLLSLGYEVLGIAADAWEAIEMAGREVPDVTLVDVNSPGWLEAGEEIERTLRAPRVILTSGVDDPRLGGPEESGYFGYVTRPFDGPKLRAAIEVAIFRHRLEAILREGESRFQATVNAMAEAMVVTDPHGMITFVNPAAEELVGVSADRLVGREAVGAIELVSEQAKSFSNPIPEALASGGTQALPPDCCVRTARGDLVPVDGSVSVVRGRGRAVLGTVTSLRNTTAQREEERRLKASEAHYRRLYNGDIWATFFLAEGGRILECSASFAELLGVGSREGMQGRSIREFLPVPLEFDYVSAVLKDRGRVLPHERALRRIDGATLHVLMSLESLSDGMGAALARVMNVTERRRLQEQSEEIRRADAVGRLAGGTAHTLGNVFRVILGSAELLAEESLEPSAEEDLGLIREAAERGAAMVRDLLSVGQRRMTRERVIEASVALREMLPMISERAGQGVLTLLQLPAKPLWMRGDPDLLAQAVGTLVDNGREAMPRGGSISVEITPVTVRPEDADWAGGLKSGEYVGVSVTDSGQGMEDDVRLQCIEPFFTTKPGHAGVGLSVASGITRQQGGWLTVASIPREGTKVTIHLPRVGESDVPLG